MNDFLVNSILVIVVVSLYFYFKMLFVKSKKKQNITSKFSNLMILIFFVFLIFILISSLFRYYENIFVNLIFLVGLTLIIILFFYKKKYSTKFYSTFEFIIIIILIFLLLLNVSTIVNKTQFISKGDSISIDEIEQGDILFLHIGLADSFIPGYWSHIGLVFDNVNDSINVIESTTHGIHVVTLSHFIGEGRVSVAKPKNLTLESRKRIIDFAKEKIGLSYDFNILNKQINGNTYYCSELIWASYMQVGIDVDKNPGFFIKFFNAVAPQEIFGDNDLIIYHINKTLKSNI